MATQLTVVVVLVVLAVIVGVALLAVQGRRRRQEHHRIEAAEHRHEAEIRAASARRREAEASEQAARARQDREVAEERHAAADRIDPDRSTHDQRFGADRSGGGWHGPSASGGFPAVDPAKREQVVPSQRTGEHDRDQHESTEDEHSGPVRALTGRLLRRRG
jgi:hypothetical protein